MLVTYRRSWRETGLSDLSKYETREKLHIELEMDCEVMMGWRGRVRDENSCVGFDLNFCISKLCAWTQM
jgi:hypothetical protein